MILKPSLFPFVRVRASNAMPHRRHQGGSKSSGNTRIAVLAKGRRFAP
jgi:hypothetical protein